MGAALSIPLLLLAVTGLLLNHADDLGLSRRGVPWPWLANWYGMDPGPLRAFRTRTHWVMEIDGSLYLDGRPVAEEAGRLYGALEEGPWLVAAAGGDLLLLEADSGVLAEVLRPGDGLPEPAHGLGRDRRGVLVRGGDHAWRPDADWLEWQPATPDSATWQTPQPPPPALAAGVRREALARMLNWERLLLDLHSARLLSRAGPWLTDLAGLGMALLAASGLWGWMRRHRARRAAQATGRTPRRIVPRDDVRGEDARGVP